MDMDALAARVKARRGDACTDSNGNSHATPAAAAWTNKRIAMKASGASREEMETLRAERDVLRRGGHNV